MDATALDVLGWIARIAVAGALVFMGVNHFRPKMARGMAAMIPPSMRREGILRPMNLVWFTGACELAGGIGILVPWVRIAAAIALVVFLIAVFPANAYAAANREKFGKAAIPFWPRLAGQIVFIALVLFAGFA